MTVQVLVEGILQKHESYKFLHDLLQHVIEGGRSHVKDTFDILEKSYTIHGEFGWSIYPKRFCI